MYQVGYFLIRNAQAFPDRTALVFKDQTVTYRELNDTANRLANHMKEIGIRKGERVAYLLPNSLELLYIWYATQKIGATAVPLNTHLLADEITKTLVQAECKTFIYHEKFKERAETVKKEIELQHIICCGKETGDGELDLELLCSTGSAKEAQIPMAASDESLLLFTSGTTGVSKGVVRSQQIVRDYALMMALENDNCHRPEILLTPCPMFHTAGMSLIMKMAALGGTLVLMDRVDCEDILRKVEQYKVTQILMVPPVLYMKFSDVENWESYDLSSVREAQFSGGKCTMEYADQIFKLFPGCKIRVSWGSTETCAPTSTVLTKEQLAEKPERIRSIGKQNTLVELRLVDQDGADVKVNETGEAIVRSPMVFKEYLGRRDLTEQAFIGDWFCTEDLLKKDEDGYYYLMDRKRDIIKTGGENVYAQEVEAVLCEHEAITDCAVIAVADPRFGEAVAAAIVLKPGCTLAYEEIADYCRSKMPSYKKPRYVAFIDALPRNSVGKLQKNSLRERSMELFGAAAYKN